MAEKGFKLLKDTKSVLKIDNDLIELQKTIIDYGDKILIESDKIQTLIRTLVQKEKGVEKSKEITKPVEIAITPSKDLHVLKHLLK